MIEGEFQLRHVLDALHALDGLGQNLTDMRFVGVLDEYVFQIRDAVAHLEEPLAEPFAQRDEDLLGDALRIVDDHEVATLHNEVRSADIHRQIICHSLISFLSSLRAACRAAAIAWMRVVHN